MVSIPTGFSPNGMDHSNPPNRHDLPKMAHLPTVWTVQTRQTVTTCPRWPTFQRFGPFKPAKLEQRASIRPFSYSMDRSNPPNRSGLTWAARLKTVWTV